MRILLAATAAVALTSLPVWAQPAPPRQERVTFARATSTTTLTGQLKGDADVDYLVRAAAGQTFSVELRASNRSTYFNVLPPGSADVAMYVAQTAAPYTDMLPTDGDYTVRVYLMRSAARRNETSTFTLTIRVTGSALHPLPAAQDALIPGTPFHASASIRCVMPAGQAVRGVCHPARCRRHRDRRDSQHRRQTPTPLRQGDAGGL